MNNYPPTLTYSYQYQPFQLQTLPVRVGSLPAPLFQNTVIEFSTQRRCPAEFGYLSALAAIAIATQNLFDVQTPNGHRFPTSLMLVGIGGPTSGKSSAGNYFLQAIEDYESTNADRLPGGGFLYKNTTGAALFSGLSELPTAGLVSCEGSEVLFGIVRKHASDLNALWSGETIKISRRHSKSFMLRSARLTMMALVHRGRLQKFLLESGDMLADTGFLSRLIVFNTEDQSSSAPREACPQPWREAFNLRLLELLELNIEAARNSAYVKRVIAFDANASQTWLRYAAQLRADGCPGGRFELAPEHAARLPENVARVAALLHVLEGYEGDISDSTLYAAMALCEEASRSFMSTFVPEISGELDANYLDDWLNRHRQASPTPRRFIPRAILRRAGPNRMRDYEILTPLIDILIGRNRVAQFKKNGTLQLDLMPWEPTWLPTRPPKIKQTEL